MEESENLPESEPLPAEEIEAEEKPRKIKKLRAEFNIADKMLEEYLRIQGEVNRVAAYSLAGDEKFNKFFFSVTFVYYINISPYMGSYETDKYDKEFSEIIKGIEDIEKKAAIPFRIMTIYRKLLAKSNELGFLVPMYSKSKGKVKLYED